MKKFWSTIFLGATFFTILNTSSVFAHEDKDHTVCSGPEQTKERESDQPFVSEYTYNKAEWRWESDVRWVPGTSTTINGIVYTTPGDYYDFGKDVPNGHTFTTATCAITFNLDPDKKYTDGVVGFKNVVAKGPKGSVGPTSGTVYWVKKVDIYLTYNGKDYLKGDSNGTSLTPAVIDGNPGNANNSLLTTYSDQDMPTVTCIKTYGDDKEEPCSPYAEVDENYNGVAGQRLTCYRWIDPFTNDSDKVCTVRIYVQEVKITVGADKTYIGEHYNYECIAIYADEVVRNVSELTKKNQKYVWMSYPQEKGMKFHDGRYIGSHWEKGYKDPRDFYHKPATLHEFYPADSQDRTYIMNCTYYPGIRWVEEYYAESWNKQWDRVSQSNNVISDYDKGDRGSAGDGTWHIPKHDKKTVQHIGIKELFVTTKGEFAEYKGEFAEYKGETEKTWKYTDSLTLQPNIARDTFPGGWNLLDEVNNKRYAPGYWNQHHFLTGHWYDFEANLEFTDGTTRDVTSAKEIYWDNTPWFKYQGKFNVEHIYDSGMSKTGLDHRIPQHGWNTIDVEYFHQNVPFGETEINRTKETNRLKAKQLKELKITHKDGRNMPPIKTINVPGDPKKVQYHAWATWTLGTDPGMQDVPENWTNFVRWDGDYLSTAKTDNISITDEWATNIDGFYDFSPMKGKGQKTTVYADYKDIDDLIAENITRVIDNKGTTQTNTYDTGNPNWEANHDEVEVTVNDCTKIPHLAWQCPLPTDYWRIDLENNFDIFGHSEEGNKNHNYYPGADYYNVGGWNEDTDLYMYQRKFPVSGTSSGLGNQ